MCVVDGRGSGLLRYGWRRVFADGARVVARALGVPDVGETVLSERAGLDDHLSRM